jgi:hypothetical protein
VTRTFWDDEYELVKKDKSKVDPASVTQMSTDPRMNVFSGGKWRMNEAEESFPFDIHDPLSVGQVVSFSHPESLSFQ